jgi:hypothetical protein
MGINSDGNVFVGQTPTYVAGATQLIVRGKTGAGFLGVNHYDMSIKGSINTFNNVFQVGTSTFHSVAFIVEDIERARINSGGRMLLGTTTDNTVDKLQIDGSLIATAIKKTGGTSTQYLMADGSVSTLASYVPTSRTLTINGTAYDLSADRSWSVGTVTSVSASVPTGFAISGSPITSSGTLAITFASGYALPTTVKQSNWDDAYTFVAAFPTQTGNAGKYLTTDGSTLSWGTVTAGVSSFNTRTGAVTLSSTDVTTALGYTPVTQARTLTINGTTFDLSADRAWTVSAGSSARNVSTFTATAGQTTFTIAGGYTPNLVDVFLNGVRLTGVDFTATNGTTIVLAVGVRVNDIIDVVNYLNAATLGITGSGTSGYLPKWTGTSVVSNSLIFDNGTNIGIGTASPNAQLHILGNSTSPFISGLKIVRSDNTSQFLNLNYEGGIVNFVATDTANSIPQMGFYTSTNGTTRTERMRITSAGNVGIGTSSPEFNVNQTSLTINGTNVSRLDMQVSGTKRAGFIVASDASYIETNTAIPLVFITNNTERMRIAADGNVGIGVVPKNWLSSVKVIQFSVGGSLWGIGASNNIFSANEYLDSAGTSRYISTDNASRYQQNAGNHVWSTAASGSADSAITFNERMRISSGGALFIGCTSDPNASTNGIALLPEGEIDISRSNGTNFVMNRNTSNGQIIDFRYNNTQVGSISTNSNSLPSDLNFKKDISNISIGLNLITKLRPVHYRHKMDDNNEALSNGLIAQELEQSLLDCGIEKNSLLMLQHKPNKKENESQYWVDYTKLIPVLIQSIKELNAKLEAK